jgi:hypothetical protein
MRASLLAGLVPAFVVALAALAACGHGAGVAPTVRPPEAVGRATAVPSGPPQYLAADPSAQSRVVGVPLPGGGLGIVVDKARLVVGRGEPRVGVEQPDQRLGGVRPIPARLGGGFLFWTDNTVYRAETFDGALKPLGRTTDTIQNVSFAPRSLLLRTQNGERWALGVPSGERVPIAPPGVADVEALDDGRAIAFDDQGAAFISMDYGAHWVDVTSQLKSSPSRVALVDDEVWLFESSGGASRLGADGQLSSFDKQPAERSPELRPKDPRWRGSMAPLRAAFRSGASVDETTAIVIEQGDVVRVDVRTGELAGVVAGRLPPDARCQGVPTAGDVLFACETHRPGQASAFVVSHTISGAWPEIEQTFQTAGQFYASDDGGLAFGGACAGGATGPHAQACVRQPGGTWQEVDVSGLASDAGGADVNVARWVPRADGRAVAIVLDPTPGLYDPRAGTFAPVEPGQREVLGGGLPLAQLKRHAPPGLGFKNGQGLVDDGWSFTTAGSLRGWHLRGGIVEVTEDGKVARSPYAFDLATAGAYALGRAHDGRLYQSTDHGATFAEVAGPPSGLVDAGEVHGCSSAGCDLGGFYRIGWAAPPPRAEATVRPAKPAPEVRRTRPVELACRPSGSVELKVLARTASSPDDLGLGNARLPVAADGTDIGMLRTPVARGIAHPLRDAPTGGDAELTSLRGLLTGYGTSRDGDTLQVLGPNRSPAALRRTLSFVAPFDPAAQVKRATIAMSEVLTAGRAAGLSAEEVLADDMTEAGSLVVVTSSDAAAPSELVFQHERGLVVRVRASGEVARLAVRPPQGEGKLISGVALSRDEAAFLELEANGVGHVFKLAGAGVLDLFDVNATATEASFYPANPDALAVGPRGELGIVRTGSGSDPASALDPALLIVPAMPQVVLAPWSTLRFADDASCKEPGWRATLQVISPWVRVTTPALRADESPMVARVKWSDKRVCLEGLEVRLADVSVRVPGASEVGPLRAASWLVSRGGVFARVAVADGLEWRQPLECSLVPPPPSSP